MVIYICIYNVTLSFLVHCVFCLKKNNCTSFERVKLIVLFSFYFYCVGAMGFGSEIDVMFCAACIFRLLFCMCLSFLFLNHCSWV